VIKYKPVNESLFQQHALMRLHISFITLIFPRFYLGRRPGNIKITSRTGNGGLSKSPGNKCPVLPS